MEIYFQAGRRTTKGGGRGVGIFFFLFGSGYGLWIGDWGFGATPKTESSFFDFLGGVLLVTYTFLKVVGLWRMGLDAKNGIFGVMAFLLEKNTTLAFQCGWD
jgi:hypothetical protein